ncbi:MAG TPA: DMT family transporter [Burkholderiaceae bacterium]|nr:DMT family transporter [Burkholderiaceae bacterium]
MNEPLRLSPRDLWLLALLTLAWGVNWPIMKIGVNELAPMSFRALTMIGGLPALAVIARVAGVPLRVPREERGELLVLALTNMVLWIVLSIYALKLLSSGRAAILAYTMPVWTALIGIALYGEHPSRRLWVGVAAAALGVLLLLGGEIGAIAGRPLGMLLMLSAAAIWGLGTHLMRRRRLRAHILTITFWSVAIGLVVCSGLALAFERGSWTRAPDAAGWGAVVYNALIVFGFAQLVWFRLVSILPPVASGLSVMLIPVIGLFSGIVMLGERPGWQDWIALAAVLVAMASVLLPVREAGAAR